EQQRRASALRKQACHSFLRNGSVLHVLEQHERRNPALLRTRQLIGAIAVPPAKRIGEQRDARMMLEQAESESDSPPLPARRLLQRLQQERDTNLSKRP